MFYVGHLLSFSESEILVISGQNNAHGKAPNKNPKLQVSNMPGQRHCTHVAVFSLLESEHAQCGSQEGEHRSLCMNCSRPQLMSLSLLVLLCIFSLQ